MIFPLPSDLLGGIYIVDCSHFISILKKMLLLVLSTVVIWPLCCSSCTCYLGHCYLSAYRLIDGISVVISDSSATGD